MLSTIETRYFVLIKVMNFWPNLRLHHQFLLYCGMINISLTGMHNGRLSKLKLESLTYIFSYSLAEMPS